MALRPAETERLWSSALGMSSLGTGVTRAGRERRVLYRPLVLLEPSKASGGMGSGRIKSSKRAIVESFGDVGVSSFAARRDAERFDRFIF